MLGAFWSRAWGTTVFEVVGVAGEWLYCCVWVRWGGEVQLVPGKRYRGHMHLSVTSKTKTFGLLILIDEARNHIVLESQFLWIISMQVTEGRYSVAC